MNELSPPVSVENPFCSRRIRPGGVAYLFPAGQTATERVERLQHHGWRGEVIGPHGSGKSALLAALIPAIERAGRRAVLIELHDGQRRLPIDLRRTPELDASAVLIVDGYEQLGRWHRWRLRRFCRCRGVGLLVSAHATVGLPELSRTVATVELALRVVEQLQCGQPAHVAPLDVAERLAARDGNLREALFDLYDLYERRRRQTGQRRR